LKRELRGAAIAVLIMLMITAGFAAGVSKTISVQLNSVNLAVNGQRVDADTILYDGVTYVPLRAAAEILDKEVGWNGTTRTASINDKAGGNQQTENNSDEKSQETPVGTIQNPISVNSDLVFKLQRYSFYNEKEFKIDLEKVTTGSRAWSILYDENMFNTEPRQDQEWRIYEFNLEYVSGPSDESLEASDILYDEYMYTEKGSKMAVYDTATFGDTFGPYGYNNVELYPGASSKVVIAMLVEKTTSEPLLKLNYNGGDSVTWIKLTIE